MTIAIVVLIVVALGATPVVYYLRSKRNPDPAPTGTSAKTYREWKD